MGVPSSAASYPAGQDFGAALGVFVAGAAFSLLLFTFVGPGRVWIVARVALDDGLPGAQVEALVRGIESGLKHEADDVYRVDVVPIGGAQAVNT